jgi:hypothetical protein
MPVWNVGRNGEWIVPTSPGGFQDWQPRTGLLVLDRIAAPPGASGSAAVATDGLLGMIVIDAGRGDVAYALPAETIVRQFKTWRFPVSIPVSTATPDINAGSGDSPAVRRAAYERSAHNCDLVADPRDFSRPADVPGTSLGARVTIGAKPPMGPIIEACRLAVEGFPEIPRYRYQLGVALSLSGNESDAAAAFRAAKQAGHEYSSVILNRLSR